MDFGLRPEELAEIIRILQKFPGVEEAILFGSRAKGNFKKGSDVDLAIKGQGIDRGIVAALSILLNEESATPYFYDIVHCEEIAEPELLDHIQRVGKCIYTRSRGSAT